MLKTKEAVLVKKTFLIEAKLRGSEEVHAEGFNPGTIAKQEISYSLTEEQYANPRFQDSLASHGREFIDSQIQTIITQIKEE